jgi:septal ring factor EnvC (AmiA/AmiB activator)
MTRRLLFCLPCLALLTLAPVAQEPAGVTPATTAPATAADGRARRVRARIQALEGEAERLVGEARTLIGDLRAREIDRDLRVEELREAQSASADAAVALREATAGLADLELVSIQEIPIVETELVNLYKRGRVGYARLLLGASNVREFARAMRAAGALTALTEGRIAAHQRTVDRLRQERATFEDRAARLGTLEVEARRARVAADQAVEAAAELIREIDSRRDLTAQFVGELREVADRLEAEVRALGQGRQAQAVAVPVRPFQGVLEWPVLGTVIGTFGQPSDRLGGSLARSGIEVSVPIDTPVRAVHDGTVGYAGTFSGFGTLVILDHGNQAFSLYGYLGATSVRQGQAVAVGAELGSVGFAPAGPAALYFELRVDGNPVDPVQWLKSL